MQDYQLAKMIDSPSLDYFSSLKSCKQLVVLNSRTKDIVRNNAIIILTFFEDIDAVLLFKRWSNVLSCKQVSYCF